MPGPVSPWRPFAELDELRSRLDRAYEQWFDGHDRPWTPSIDVERGKRRRERRYGSFTRSMAVGRSRT